jgi:hypothetical protein
MKKLIKIGLMLFFGNGTAFAQTDKAVTQR